MITSLAIGSDRRLAIIAGAGVVLSIGAMVARVADRLPAGPAAVVVLVGVTIGLRVALTYATKAASSPARTRAMSLVSTVGLALSAVTSIAVLPHITKTAGFGTFSADLSAQLWTLAILTAMAGAVRTLGWRALAGAGLTGFLALTGLARLIARPVVVALGQSSILATALWVPLTEEIVKAIPLAVVVAVALRRSVFRPSALDLMLVGAWTGAGFAVYENAVLGRGGFHLGTVPLLSLLVPSALEGHAVGWTVVQTGHLVHTAIIGLGIGFALLYRQRMRRAWVFALVAVLAVLLEHVGQNALALSHVNTTVAHVVLGLTLNGRLSSLLLFAGVCAVLAIEWRAVGGEIRPSVWTRLPATEANRRASRLAQAQHAAGVPAVSPLTKGVA